MKKGRKKLIALAIIIITLLAILLKVIPKIYHSYTFISSATRNSLINDLINVEGEQYNGKCIATQLAEESEIQILEDMRIHISRDKIVPWNDSMPTKDKNGFSFSHTNWISVYVCQLDIVRYISVNDNIVPNSETHKYITYIAYEDRDLNSMATTIIDFSSKKYSYSDGQEYFDNPAAQIDNYLLDYNSTPSYE